MQMSFVEGFWGLKSGCKVHVWLGGGKGRDARGGEWGERGGEV